MFLLLLVLLQIAVLIGPRGAAKVENSFVLNSLTSCVEIATDVDTNAGIPLPAEDISAIYKTIVFQPAQNDVINQNKILLVSYIDEASFNKYAKFSYKINQLFALFHNYSCLLLSDNNNTSSLHQLDRRWEKVSIMRLLLQQFSESSAFDYFVWFDADLIFLDIFSHKSFLHTLIDESSSNVSFIISSELHAATGAANTGCFIVKNSNFSKAFLNQWYHTNHSLGHDQILFDTLYKELLYYSSQDLARLPSDYMDLFVNISHISERIQILPINLLNSIPPVYFTFDDHARASYHVLHLMGESNELRGKIFEFIYRHLFCSVNSLHSLDLYYRYLSVAFPSLEPIHEVETNFYKLGLNKVFLQLSFYELTNEKIQFQFDQIVSLLSSDITDSMQNCSTGNVINERKQTIRANELIESCFKLITDIRENFLLLEKFPVEDLQRLLFRRNNQRNERKDTVTGNVDGEVEWRAWKTQLLMKYNYLFQSLYNLQKDHILSSNTGLELFNSSVLLNLINFNIILGNDFLASFIGNEKYEFAVDGQNAAPTLNVVSFDYVMRKNIFHSIEYELFPSFHQILASTPSLSLLPAGKTNNFDYLSKMKGIFYQNKGKFYFTLFQDALDKSFSYQIDSFTEADFLSFLKTSLNAFFTSINIYHSSFYPSLLPPFLVNVTVTESFSSKIGVKDRFSGKNYYHELEIYEMISGYSDFAKAICYSLKEVVKFLPTFDWNDIYTFTAANVPTSTRSFHNFSDIFSFALQLSDESIRWLRDLLFIGGVGQKVMVFIPFQENHFLFERLIYERMKCFFSVSSSPSFSFSSRFANENREINRSYISVLSTLLARFEKQQNNNSAGNPSLEQFLFTLKSHLEELIQFFETLSLDADSLSVMQDYNMRKVRKNTLRKKNKN
jgi:hypothetical protein